MKKIFGILAVCAIAASAMAVPARRDGIVRTNAEGEQITVYLHGDETFHFLTDEKGQWLEEESLKPMSEEMKKERMRIQENAYAARRARQAKNDTLPRLLAPKGAIILVSFKDKAFQQTHEDMLDWAMGDNYTKDGGTGSIRQYFLDQSWGEYDMDIDIFGPVTLSKNMSYYGKNDYWGNDQHADEMVKEACILAHDSCGADFSMYDNNNDGNVDWVVILYAGYGEASGAPSTTVWPHQYELSYTGMEFDLDGKTIDHYCCLNELDGTSGSYRDGIGTFCHEFGHVMGLPDFYETNNPSQGIHTLVDWDIMDYGPYNNNGNTPPSYSAYERWYMGWITPRILTDPEDVVLEPLNDSKEALLMCEGDEHNLNPLDPNPKTFYLIENRKKESWDRYLPGKGMLITKVQYDYSKWRGNEVNNSKNSQGIDLIEARTNTGVWGKATDAFPAGATRYEGFKGHEITNITLGNNGVIQFLYRDGGAQGVEEVLEQGPNAKRIENGQLVIVRDGKKYNVLGSEIR